MAWWWLTGGAGGGALVALLSVWLVRRIRTVRNGGVFPLPGWRLTERHLPEEVRAVIARVARSAAKDFLTELGELGQLGDAQRGRHTQ